MSADGRVVLNKTSKFGVLDVSGVKQEAKGTVANGVKPALNATGKAGAKAGTSVGKNSKSVKEGTADAAFEIPEFDPSRLRPSECSLQERYDLCRSVADECIQEDELRNLLEAKAHPICYDGFEPSGRMHIAQGVMRVINVNKLTKSGCHFKFWVADWFAQLNNKMGGDLKKIQTVGKYMVEIWRAAGMDMNNVQFLWASEEINKRPNEYWSRVMEIARVNNLSRVQRCGQIMGRAEAGEMSSAQILYPCMQCADVFFLKADICQLGLDQRKVNMLAREYCGLTKPKIKHKPVILSHHMLAGLKEGQAKMSKSDPGIAFGLREGCVRELKNPVERNMKSVNSRIPLAADRRMLSIAKGEEGRLGDADECDARYNSMLLVTLHIPDAKQIRFVYQEKFRFVPSPDIWKEGKRLGTGRDISIHDSAIFMEDSVADVARKIKKAYCPPEVVAENPVLDYCKHIVFAWYGQMTISPREGDPVVYAKYEDLEEDYVAGKVHPSELKPAVADALNKILQPVRDHFEHGEAKKLLETVRKFKVTR